MAKDMKKNCTILGGKWDSEAKVCLLKLTDMKYSSDNYLYLTFGDVTLTVSSWDDEMDLPNYLNIDVYNKKKEDLKWKMRGLRHGNLEREKLIKEIKKYRLDLDLSP